MNLSLSPGLENFPVRTAAASLTAAAADARAGIRIATIAGSEDLSLYAAEIPPRGMVAPHFHLNGTELYQIMEGDGLLRIGRRENDAIIRYREMRVAAGDCFAIPEGMIHNLVNTGGVPLIALFSCPAAHLGADRHFISQEE